jgi:hypothetical protein
MGIAARRRRGASLGHSRPTARADVIPAIASGAVLVFGAMPARTRWREALVRSGRVELRNFVFVA